MLERFAIETGNPIIAWRLPMTPKYEKQYANRMDVLYSIVRDMIAYFVSGAPCSLTENVRPEKGLSNGTSGRVHSLVLDPEEPALTLDSISNAALGQVVFLKNPPFVVNVEIPKESTTATGINDDLHRDDGVVVVPSVPCTTQVNLEQYIPCLKKRGVVPLR